MNKGFTLVELLLVVALLTISVGITGDILLTLVRSFSKTQVLTEIEQQSNFVSLKLEKELKSASSVSAPDSDDYGSTLTFEGANGTVSYSLAGGILSRNGVALTSNENPGGVVVTCSCPDGADACFVREGTGNPEIISFCLTFTQAQTGAAAAFTGEVEVEKTVVLRRSY